MTSTFLSAYLHEVTSNLSNWHEDNYDFYRFGPQPQEQTKRSWKVPIIDYLRRRGYVKSKQWSDWVMAAVRLVEAHLTHFEWLYNKLADDESRDILVKVLAFRALGHRKVKLPLNTLTYWDELKRTERLADPSDFISVSFLNWKLHLIRLDAVGVPIKLYCTPQGAYHQFILEQYRCKSDITDIAVEPGEYVIDAGACWGDTALYFANRSRPDGRVFSFEFVQDNLEILRRNLLLNPELKGRIQVIERAVWNESNVTIAVQGEGPGSRAVRQTDTFDVGILTLAIDDLVTQWNLPRLDFIKMDIEGAELPALRGATQAIARFKPKMAISVYHHLTDFFEVPEFLDSLGVGYRFFLRHNSIYSEETVLFAKVGRQ